jgi:hypothetical protein
MKAACRIVILGCSLFALASCGLTIENVRYGWPVESVLPVGDDNMIQDERYGIRFMVTAIAQEEFESPGALRGKEIRLIQSAEGLYFITAKRFKHVYVLRPGESELKLENSILVAEHGLQDPAFNQRPPFVELLDGGKVIRLTADGIAEEAK